MPLGYIISLPEGRKNDLAAVPEDGLWDAVEALRDEALKTGSVVDLMKAFMDFQSYTLESEAFEDMFLGSELVGLVDGGECVVQFNPPEKTAELSQRLESSPDSLFTELRLAVASFRREQQLARAAETPEYEKQGFLDKLLGRPKTVIPRHVPDLREDDYEWETELWKECTALYAKAANDGHGMLTVVTL